MNAIPLKQAAFLDGFTCLGDACEDTCCKGWGMQLDPATKARYEAEAPELLEAVDTGEAEWIMKRDPKTDYCIKYDQGWCGIHKDRGTDFLGDACHFFPRITRGLGNTHIMSAALSCPEITRRALFSDAGVSLTQDTTERVPYSLTDYLPDELEEEQALAIHQAFLDAASDDTLPPERLMAQLISVATSMAMIDMTSWPTAAGFYLKNAESRLPAPEEHPADPFHLLNALVGLVSASKPTARPRLEQTISDMEDALAAHVDRETLSIGTADDSYARWQALQADWNAGWRYTLDPVLRRWIATQLSMSLFPFAGFGDTLAERASIIGVRFATVRLALMATCRRYGGPPPKDEQVRVIQGLARFLDHLADPTLSVSIYAETGWLREPRMRALLLDA